MLIFFQTYLNFKSKQVCLHLPRRINSLNFLKNIAEKTHTFCNEIYQRNSKFFVIVT